MATLKRWRMAYPAIVMGALLATPAQPDGPPRVAPSLIPDCLDEIAPAARAACLGALAERLLHDLDTRLAGFAAETQGAPATSIRGFEEALTRDQRIWRRGMEDDCARRARAAGTAGNTGVLARQTCRLDAARARASRIADLIAAARSAAGIAPTPPPDCRVYLDQPTGRPPRPDRARPRIECDLTDLPGIDPAVGWPAD